jgi:serine/threonine protein kinase
MNGDLGLCPGCFQVEQTGDGCAGCGYRLDPDAFPTTLAPGTQVSRYTVGRVLGKPGGFGVTYLAFDPVLKRRLAVKELMPRELVARRPDGETLQVQTRDDEDLFRYTLTSFLNEARLIAQLSHPNVVRVLDFFEANGTAYFAMEYYEGQALSEYVQAAGGRLPGDQAVALLLPILDGLDHIHSRDEPVLHRDIKPSNIYLAGGKNPILLDFGAARVTLGQQSRSLSAVLTPGFAPYEQYSTRGDQGPWTDVYGCAATLYFLVTGRPPPEASVRIDDPRIEPPHAVVPHLDPRLSAAIVQGLGFRPRERPQSAREFADLLTGRSEGERATDRTPAGFGGAQDAPTAVGRRPLSWDVATEVERDAGAPPPFAPYSASGPAEAAATVLASPTPVRPTRSRRGATPIAVGLGVITLVAASLAFGLTRQGDDAPAVVEDEHAHVVDDDERGGELAFRPEDDPVPVDPEVTTPPEGDPEPEPASGPDEPQAPEASPPDPAPAAPPASAATGVLVIVYGDEPREAQRAETTVLRALAGQQGLQPLDPSSLSMIRGDQAAVEAANRGDFAALAALGREHGAEFLVVGDLASHSTPSVGQFFSGTAEMDLKMYRVSTGILVEAGTFRVGSGGAQPVLNLNDAEARSRAAEEASNQAAAAARGWLRRAFP